MSQSEKLHQFLESLAQDVNGFIGASVVDEETGMSLASLTHVSNFDLDVAAAYNSEMVKAKNKTIRALGLDSSLVDMLLTLDNQLHLIRVLNGGLFVYLAASSEATNLALLRASVRRNVEEFNL